MAIITTVPASTTAFAIHGFMAKHVLGDAAGERQIRDADHAYCGGRPTPQSIA